MLWPDVHIYNLHFVCLCPYFFPFTFVCNEEMSHEEIKYEWSPFKLLITIIIQNSTTLYAQVEIKDYLTLRCKSIMTGLFLLDANINLLNIRPKNKLHKLHPLIAPSKTKLLVYKQCSGIHFLSIHRNRRQFTHHELQR